MVLTVGRKLSPGMVRAPSNFGLPGGKADPLVTGGWEAPVATAVRETEEETGAILDHARLELVHTDIIGKYIVHAFWSRNEPSRLKVGSREGTPVVWRPVQDVWNLGPFREYNQVVLGKISHRYPHPRLLDVVRSKY